jgi:hypothetical protein
LKGPSCKSYTGTTQRRIEYAEIWLAMGRQVEVVILIFVYGLPQRRRRRIAAGASGLGFEGMAMGVSESPEKKKRLGEV